MKAKLGVSGSSSTGQRCSSLAVSAIRTGSEGPPPAADDADQRRRRLVTMTRNRYAFRRTWWLEIGIGRNKTQEEVKEKNALVQWRKMKITSWGLLRGHVMGPI